MNVCKWNLNKLNSEQRKKRQKRIYIPNTKRNIYYDHEDYHNKEEEDEQRLPTTNPKTIFHGS